MSNPFYYINIDIDCGKTKRHNMVEINDINFPNENKKMMNIKQKISKDIKNIEKDNEYVSNLDKFVLTQKKFNQYFFDMK